MGVVRDTLDDIRRQLAPDDATLREARARRDTVLASARTFPGRLRDFRSGSLAHGTANCPIHRRDAGLDADCGTVLDRRSWPALGPDSPDRGGPLRAVWDLRDHVGSIVRKKYPQARCTVTKRAIYVTFGEPLPEGEDPTVDLVLGLTRRDARGLWIPNTDGDSWDASDPETHTRLLTAEPAGLRRVRARAIRLAKAEIKRTGRPPLCSFNVEALGLAFVEDGMDEVRALMAIWEGGAAQLAAGLTADPAGVSTAIRCDDRVAAGDHLRRAAHHLQRAVAAESDPEVVARELSALWPEFVSQRPGEASRASLVASYRTSRPTSVTAQGLLAVGGAASTVLKQPRSFGAGAV